MNQDILYDTNTSPTFLGGTGQVTTDINEISRDISIPIVVQADGKILQGGTTNFADLALVRYNNDGSLDTSFDYDGKVITDIGIYSFDLGYLVALQSDGKVLLSGACYNSFSSINDFALVRYNIDGSLDASFGNDGKVTTTADSNFYYSKLFTRQTDGKILACGSSGTLMRYNNDGSLDTSFGNNGKVTTAIDINGGSIAMQTDGKILMSGNNHSLMRYNSDGSLDTSFDSDGKVTNAVIGNDPSITMQADGKILFCNGNKQSFTLIRYNTDGSIDTSFNNDGKITTNVNDGNKIFINSVTVQADGKVLLGGSSLTGNNKFNYDFTLIRYNTDGSLDTSFNLVNTLNSNPTFFENSTAVVLDNTVQIHDTELAFQGNYNGASISLARQGGASTDDIFSNNGPLSFNGDSAVLSGIVIGTISNSNGTLTIDFNSNATQARVNEVLSSIAYSNVSDNPPALVHIDWTFNDGNTGAQGNGGNLATTGTSIINIIAINEVDGTINSDIISGTATPDQINGLAGNDKLKGLAAMDLLNGGEGNDILDGGRGSDTLIGGLEKDKLVGGLGADKFKFNSEVETGIKVSTRDIIIDFNHQQGDKIDLSAIDANTAFEGDNAFSVITVGGTFSGIFSNPGELYFDKTAHVLYGNNDVNSAANFSIQLTGVDSLTSADFVL